jgi:hypothetical protein
MNNCRKGFDDSPVIGVVPVRSLPFSGSLWGVSTKTSQRGARVDAAKIVNRIF